MRGGRRSKRSTGAGSKRVARAAWKNVLADRLRQAFGAATFREIAKATGHNHETVRRFLATGSPRVSFLVETSKAYGVSVDWLLGLVRKK